MSLFSPHSPKKRLLAVGGTHVFESNEQCKLTRAQPDKAVKDLHWQDTLALEALNEGTAEVTCGDEKIDLEIVVPTRLEIKLRDGKPTEAGDTFQVEALLYGANGEQLEVGKFTTFEWTSSGDVQAVNDRSGGEFGLCDTCYGMQKFRVLRKGSAWIEVHFGSLQGRLALGG
jgi:hypothetical protein